MSPIKFTDRIHDGNLEKRLRFSTKQYPKLDDDGFYDLICNLYWQLQHRIPSGPAWLGNGLMQWPQDLIAYQELMWDLKPDLVVETGTAGGGCTLFFASVLELMRISGRIADYQVVTVEVSPNNPSPDVAKNPRIHCIKGDSVSAEALDRVRSFWASSKTTMVFLDSGHDQPHVSEEIEAYSPLVSLGSYLIVEDTTLDYVQPYNYTGPLGAVKQFLENHEGWAIDRYPERWPISLHPCGYLKRVG